MNVSMPKERETKGFEGYSPSSAYRNFHEDPSGEVGVRLRTQKRTFLLLGIIAGLLMALLLYFVKNNVDQRVTKWKRSQDWRKRLDFH